MFCPSRLRPHRPWIPVGAYARGVPDVLPLGLFAFPIPRIGRYPPIFSAFTRFSRILPGDSPFSPYSTFFWASWIFDKTNGSFFVKRHGLVMAFDRHSRPAGGSTGRECRWTAGFAAYPIGGGYVRKIGLPMLDAGRTGCDGTPRNGFSLVFFIPESCRNRPKSMYGSHRKKRGLR